VFALVAVVPFLVAAYLIVTGVTMVRLAICFLLVAVPVTVTRLHHAPAGPVGPRSG
jgi:hypothetical protein